MKKIFCMLGLVNITKGERIDGGEKRSQDGSLDNSTAGGPSKGD